MSTIPQQDFVKILRHGTANERRLVLENLYATVYPAIKKMTANFKGNKEDAEDIFQEGVAILYQHLVTGRFKGESTVQTYLVAICKNMLRMQQRNRKPFHEDVDSIPLAAAVEEPKIQVAKVRMLIEGLPEECASLLKLFYFDKLPMTSIMKKFGLGSEQAAKTKKLRCMQRLMKRVQEAGMSLDDFLD